MTYMDVSMIYETFSDSAIGGIDFTNQNNQIFTIPAFSSSGTISIPITNDEIFESTETFTVLLSSLQNASFSISQVSGSVTTMEIDVKIIDDDKVPLISFANLSPQINESESSLTIEVQLSNVTTHPVSVNYSTTDVTATGGVLGGSGLDYVSQTNQQLNFDPGEVTAEITIPIIQDSLNEGDESFSVTLSNPIGAEFTDLYSTIVLTITIIDDEMPTLSIVDSTLNVSERAGVTAIELELSGPISKPVEVSYFTSIESTDTTVQADFTSQPFKKISIQPSSTAEIIAIPITNDSIIEGNETFTLTLSEVSGAELAGGSTLVEQVTIIDDEELPTLSVDATLVEIDEGSGSALIDLTLSAPTANTVAVTYSTIGISASNDGTDYVVQTNAIYNIMQNMRTGMITIPIMDDGDLEDEETFVVKLTGVSGAAFGPGLNEIAIMVTILDNETMPTLSVPYTRLSVFESADAMINLRLSHPSDSVISFSYSTSIGTASAADFSEHSLTHHTFGSGMTDTILIPIVADNLAEIDETFSVTFSNLSGATFVGEQSPTITVTILDDDQPIISISDSSGREEDGGLSFTVRLSHPSSRDSSVTWTAFSDTNDEAIRGIDYASAPNSHTGVLTIPAGSLSTSIEVPIVDDTLNENNEESFSVILTNPSAGAEVSNSAARAAGTILDDDVEPTITVPAMVSGIESDGNIEIPILLSNMTYQEVELFVTTTPGTATGGGTDFANQNRQMHSIPEFTSSGIISIPIVNDRVFEGPETFTVTINSLNTRVTSIETTVTIIDDETLPEVNFLDSTPTVNESDGTLRIRAQLNHTSTQAASVNYSTSNGSATGSLLIGTGDYITQSDQPLNFSIGATYADITIPINQDSLHEGNETFVVTLSNAMGAKFLGSASMIEVTVTIIDDEEPTLSVDSSTLSASERAGKTAIKLNLSGPTSGSVVVTYSTSIVSGSDTAVQADFTGHFAQTVSIASSQTIGKIEIPITNDSEIESDETFTLTLTGITGAEFSGGTSIVVKVTIIDDEGLPTLTFDSATVEVTEGGSQAAIGLILAPTPTSNVIVTYSTAPLTASNDGTDYVVYSNSTHRINSGNASSSISIPIINDDRFEPTETFNVIITGVTGAAFEANVQELIKTVTILDDESVPTVSVQSTSVTATESGNAEIIVQVANLSESVVSFTYSTTIGTASSADFTVQNSVRHAFGSESTDKILIPITDDDIDELDEQFTVTLANLSGATFNNGVAPTVTVIIQDDDQAQFSIADSSQTESSSGTFNMDFDVSLNKQSSRNTSVTWSASSDIG